jgi:undecaprenyl diphosphate synthase
MDLALSHIFKRKETSDHSPDVKIDRDHLPRHIGVIMDGNGRWAKKKGLPRTAGHAAGAETFRTIATYSKDLGVRYFTVYAFSTENWKRPAEEVNGLMNLFRKYLKEAIETMARENLAVQVIGDLHVLAPDVLELVECANSMAAKLSDCAVATLCINYGGRDEIKNAVQEISRKVQAGVLQPEEITEETISRHLYTRDMPDPDLIIRPSGEIRISNFLLWQSAYAEYYFTDTLWPDFEKKDLDAAILAYQKRSRRFGGV